MSREKWWPAVRLMTLLLYLFGLGSGGNETYAAAPYSGAIELTKKTDVYEEPMISLPPVFQLTPQEVYITGMKAEDGNFTWYRIGTWRGEKWVHLAEDDFHGLEQLASYDAAVLTDAELYDEPLGRSSTGIVISPQTVHVKAVSGAYLKITTWLGDKWIHSSENTILDVNLLEETIDLAAVTPIFVKPDAASERIMELAPQRVLSYEQVNGWYHIRTDDGSAWMNPLISLPQHAESTQVQVQLTQRSMVYAYPSFNSKPLGSVAPQQVQAYERAGNWLHVRSDWLGEGWVYPVENPDMYETPRMQQEIPAATDWKFIQLEIGGFGGRAYPLSAELRFKANYGQQVTTGSPVSIGMSLTSLTSAHEIQLQQPASFALDVIRLDKGKEERVWSTKLPALHSTTIPGNGSFYTEDMIWDQTDFDGRQVPQGNYEVRIRPVEPITFTEAQVDGMQTLALDHRFASQMIHIALPSSDKRPLNEIAEHVFRHYLLSLEQRSVPDTARISDFRLYIQRIDDERPDEFSFRVIFDVAPASDAYVIKGGGVRSGEGWVNSQMCKVRVSRDVVGSDGVPKMLSVEFEGLD